MPDLTGGVIYRAQWLERERGRGLQSYFTSGQYNFPPAVKYIVYKIRYIGPGTGTGAFTCVETVGLNPYEDGGVPDTIGTTTEVVPYQPATNSNGTPIIPPPTTIPTDNENFWRSTIEGAQSITTYENPDKIYAYIIKAYDSDNISNPQNLTGCVSQVVVYGRILGLQATSAAVTFQNTTVLVNWNVNLQGLPINTYVETLTLPVRFFNGVFLIPQYT